MLFLAFSLCSSVEVNGIFKRHYNDKIIVIDVSGSSKQDINGTIQLTKPEYAILPWDKRYDWCSNCGKTYDEHPWIIFSLDNRQMKINGYFIRAGCCYENRCCCDDGVYYCIECCLYSWSLQVSDDNKTWTEVHKIDKDRNMRRCAEKEYKFDKEYTARYVRLIQNERCPGNPPCLAINRIELYGDVVGENNAEDFVSFHDDDEDVSIIGHISKNGKVIVK